MKEIDARGMDCPKPVIKTKQALEEHTEVTTIVDNQIAADNLTRLGNKMGCEVTRLEEGEEYKVFFKSKANSKQEVVDVGKVYFITSEYLGTGAEELSEFLIKGFINTLLEMEPLPAKIIFINSGVKLPTLITEIEDDLLLLEKKGVDILACGACLDYYDLKDKLKVGQVSNMYEIVSTLNSFKVVKV